MFVVNEDNSIYATRGDIVFFSVTADDDGKPYKFQAGDVVRIKVYGKKDAENVVLQKDFPVYDITESVEIYLTEEDTKFGEVISKPKDYWYEVELNPFDNPQTIIGYDEDGAKVFKLFPEGDDVEASAPEITPEDIPVVDEELDMTSDRPVQNQAIARAFENLVDGYERTRAAMEERYATPQMYGALGDGESDDTDAINACLANNKRVYLPEGTYKIEPSVSLIMQNNQVLELADNAVITASVTDETKYNYAVTIKGVSNVTVRGGKICGDRLEYPDSTAERGYGIYICNSHNVSVENCEISDFRGDCIIIESFGNVTDVFEYNEFVNTNIRISGCKIQNSLRHGITVMGVRGLVVKDTEIYYTDGKSYSCAIDAETHYEWQEMSDIRCVNVRAYYCGNGVLFNEGSFAGTIKGVSVENCNLYRAQFTMTGAANIERSNVEVVSLGGVDDFAATHCVFVSLGLPHTAKKIVLNKCVFNCEEYRPEAITFRYSAEVSTVDFEANDCIFNSYVSDVKDVAKTIFNIQCLPRNLTFSGCTIYSNNPNAVRLYAENILKVFGCKFVYRFNQDGYPSALISAYGANSFIVGNIFDTTQAHATSNTACVLECSFGDVFFANNVGVMTEKYGAQLAVSAGESGRTWTMMNNVFPLYSSKGQTIVGVDYIEVGNIYSGTT